LAWFSGNGFQLLPWDTALAKRFFIIIGQKIPLITPQQQPEDSQTLRDLNNNRPEDDFGGLTFNEINRLTFDTMKKIHP
jgi:hypothetical protein